MSHKSANKERGDSSPPERSPRSRLSGVVAIVVVILVTGGLVLAPSIQTYLEQRQEITRLESFVHSQQVDLDHLRNERQRWNDKNFVTSQARDRLYYVYPGEVSYLVINDMPQQQHEENPPAPSAASQSGDWVSSLFSSYIAAGLAPEPSTQSTP